MRCRHDALVAARDRMQRLTLRGGALIIIVATVITAVLLGRAALRDRPDKGRGSAAPTQTAPGFAAVTDSLAADSAAQVAQVAGDSTMVVPQGIAQAPPQTPQPKMVMASEARPGAPSAQPTRNAPPAAALAHAPISPLVPIGQSSLRDGVTANRGDSIVVVLFDTPNSRTRIPEKFERVLRTTLPAIYGPAADSALARIPSGGIARQGDLLSVLTARGVRIPLVAPWEIRVYPETRSGQGGPLVIRYRASVVTAGE
ncbi:MAG: hypothetical protein ABJF01_16805 [bacterium]